MKIKRVGQPSKKQATCSNCGHRVVLHRIKEYHLDTVGLPNVWLLNIDGYECDNCKNGSIFIPNYGLLITVITEIVIFKNGSYTSQELVFLKKYFGLKSKDLARKLGTNEKTVSFWLTGKSRVSPAYGIKLRKFLLESYVAHLEKKKKSYKGLCSRMKKILNELKGLEELNYKEYLRYQAELTVKRKLAEFKSVMDREVPTYKIPDSIAEVQLRYS